MSISVFFPPLKQLKVSFRTAQQGRLPIPTSLGSIVRRDLEDGAQKMPLGGAAAALLTGGASAAQAKLISDALAAVQAEEEALQEEEEALEEEEGSEAGLENN